MGMIRVPGCASLIAGCASGVVGVASSDHTAEASHAALAPVVGASRSVPHPIREGIEFCDVGFAPRRLSSSPESLRAARGEG